MATKQKERVNGLEVFRENLVKMFGKNSEIVVENLDERVIEKFPTGSLKLTKELKGGYVKGKIVEFSGDPQSGKTTTCIEGAAEFQKKYPKEVILWVDLEDVYDPEYNSSIGLNVSKNFILVKPETGEQAWDIIINFCRTITGGLVVLDSVALLLPEKEDEGDTGDASMALAARMNSKGLRKIMPHLSKQKTTFFVVNQLRTTIGGYGDPNITTGGKAWAYYARTRIKCVGLKGEEGIFSNHRLELIKANYGNKDAKPVISIIYGQGFDQIGEMTDLAVDFNIIQKAGSWYSYGETKLGQGANAVRELLVDNPEFFEEIKTKINEKITG